MTENLDYNDGCLGVPWSSSDVGLCSYYPGGAPNEGLLYQWSAAMDGSTTEGVQGICPPDWHVPTDAELKTLVEGQATGGCESGTGFQCSPAGDRLKYSSTPGTDSQGICVNDPDCDLSYFDGLLAGYRHPDGSFRDRGAFAWLWSSSQSGTAAWRRYLSSASTSVHRNIITKPAGLPVRCLRGTGVSPYIDIGLRIYDGTTTVSIGIEPGAPTSPLRIQKNGTTYGVGLVDVSDPKASKMRIETSTGVKALYQLAP